MVTITNGNIFESTSEAIVNPVNCQGVIGKGLAKQFRFKYPRIYRLYRLHCQEGLCKIGTVPFYFHSATDRPKYIAYFPTKDHYNQPSKIEYIQKGLIALRLKVYNLNIKSISIPALGCGLGKLDFQKVSELVVNEFANFKDTDIYLYRPEKPIKIFID